MANDIISKYVKKGQKKSIPVVQKSGSWLSNVLKSVGYSSFDVLSELMPATVDTAKSAATVGRDIATSLKRAKTSDRTLKDAISRNYYTGIGRDMLKNSLEDLKTGKFYNKERTEAMYDSMNDFDMGDMDFDIGDDSYEDFDADDFSGEVESVDGSSRARLTRKKGRNVESIDISVNTDMGPDSTIVQATQYQTETSINVGRAYIDTVNANARASLTMVGNLRNEVNASLGAISENVSQISSVVSETLSQHNLISAKYYEDSLSIQRQILDTLKAQPVQGDSFNTKKFRDYNNVLDLFNGEGGIDFSGYKDLVKRQFKNYSEGNMLLSQLSFMNDNRDVFQQYAASPLQSALTKGISSLIPNVMQKAMKSFDEQLKETGVAALNQVSGLTRSSNPFLSAIGQIFGVQNKITASKIDKGAYNKGPMAWNGMDHQALTNVIPTLLRKIYASVSGTQEIVFDYEKGIYRNLAEVEKEHESDKRYRETSGFMEYKSGFNEFLDKNFAMSSEDKNKYNDRFEEFISKLVRDSNGGRTFRLGGRNGRQTNESGEKLDDIRDLLGAVSSDSTDVKLIRSYLQTLEKKDKAALTRFFGSRVQEQRQTIDRNMREMQLNPTRFNTMYMDTGLSGDNKTNAHLAFDENDKSKIVGVKSGVAAGVTDKYKRNANYYLREILTTLTTGIYVVPVGSLNADSGNGKNVYTAIRDRRKSSLNNIRSDVRASDARAASNRPTSNYTDEKRQKDVEEGKIDLNADNLSQTQLTTAVLGNTNEEVTNENTENKPGIIGKILGKIPPDSGLGRIIGRLSKGRDKAGEKGTSIFNTLNDALFKVVFGGEDGERGFKSIFNKSMDVLKSGFASFATFLDTKIFKPLDNALFGDDGLVNKIKESDFGKKMSETFDKVKDKVGNFILGEKDADGNRSGGIFSETANSLKDIGKQVKTGILGEKGPDGKPLPLDQDNSVLGNMKKIFKNVSNNIKDSLGMDGGSKEPIGTRISNTMGKVFSRISERANDWTNTIFGPDEDGGGDETTRILHEKFVTEFKEDMKGQKGFIGASASIGALSSFFLPGGPIGGALLGAGVGIVTKSRGLQDMLFGPKDDDGERVGGLITKGTQDFFKDNKMGMGVGAGLGLGASIGILPSFFLPGGPIGGALIGTTVSLIAKSGAFNDILYGPGGTKDDPTGGLSKKFKEVFGKDKTAKNVGIDAGIGAGVGVLGSFFLPGGPILGGLIGSAISIGTATDKFRNWFFGEPGEDGKRNGGVLTNFKNKLSDFFNGEKDEDGKRKGGLLDKLKSTAQLAQAKIGRFIETQMVIPFKTALDPLTAEAKNIASNIKDKITGVFDSFKERLHEHVTKPIGDSLKKHFLDPMKNFFTKLFSGFGKLVGNIISAPFKLIGATADKTYEKHKKRGRQHYIDTVNKELNPFKRENQEMPDRGPFKRLRGFASAVGTWGASRFDKNALESSQYNDAGAYYDRDNEVKWDERKRQAIEDANRKWDERESSIRNGTFNLASDKIRRKQAEEWKAESGDRNNASGFEDIASNKSNTIRGKSPDTSINTEPSGSSVDLLRGLQNDSNNEESNYTPEDNTNNTTVNTSSSNTDSTFDSGISNGTGGFNQPNNNTNINITPPESSNNSSTFDSGVSNGTGGFNYTPDNSSSNNTSVDTSSSVPESNYTPEKETKFHKSGKSDGSLISKIQKDVSKISDSVYGQLNGVGSNVNKIYRLLLKRFGKKDEDIQGDNNKDYVGFFGKIRTALNNPLKAIGNIITAPFRKIGEGITAIGKGIKNVGSSLINGIASLGKGIVSVGKSLLSGIGGILTEVAKVPFDIMHTALSGVRALLPAIGEGAKAVGIAIGETVKVAGNIITSGVKAVGNTIVNAAEGLGSMIGSVVKGIGTLFGGAMAGLGKLFSGLGLISADVLKTAWSGLKLVGKGVGSIVSAPVKAISGLISKKKDKGNGGGLFGKGPIHVIVDSGTLDLVKKVNKVVGLNLESDKETGSNTEVNGASRLRMNLNMFSGSNKSNDNEETSVSTSGESNDTNDTSVDTNSLKGKLGTAWGNAKSAIKEASGNVRNKLKAKDDAEREARVSRGSRMAVEERIAKEDKEKSEASFRERLLSGMNRTAVATEEHSSGFFSTFGLKKGLITTALVALIPFIIKFVKKLDIGKYISDLGNTITTGFKEIGGLLGLVNNVEEKAEHVSDTITGQDTHNKVDENGNLVYDENGNIEKETTDSTHLSEYLTPTRTRIDTETGKWSNDKTWTTSSDSRLNFGANVVKKGAKKVVKTYQRGKKLVSGVKTVAGTVKKVGKKALDTATSHSEKLTSLYVHADDAVKAGKKTLKTTGSKIVSKVTKDDGVIGKAIKFMSQALDFLVEKFVALGTKYGIKIGEGKLGIKAIRGMLKGDKLKAYSKKISDFIVKITGKQTAAAGTLFLADIGFAVYGALDGASNAGALFEVQPDDVDAKMRAIAGVFKALLNTSIGSWVDLINSLVYEILGFNFVKTIASHVYKLLSGDEDDKKLEEAQEQFTADYEAYVKNEYEAYVEDCNENGQTPMSEDEFKASNLSTTRDEYNASVNKSLAKRVVDGVKGIGKGITKVAGKVKDFGGNVVKGVKNFGSKVIGGVKSVGKSAGKAVGKFLFGDKEKVFYTSEGSYYKKNGDTYDYYSANGSKIGEGFGSSEIEPLIENGTLTEGTIGEEGAVSKVSNGIKSIGKGLANGWKSVVERHRKRLDTFVNVTKKVGTKVINSIKNSATAKHLTKFFVGTNETRYYDTKGNYYTKNSSNLYDYYDGKGNKIAESVDEDTFTTMLDSGQLVTKEVTEKSTISKIGDSVVSIGGKLKDGFVNAINKRIEFAKEVGSKALGAASSALTSIQENGLFGSIKNFFTDKKEKAYFDMKGNYYLKQSDGTYKYFNGNGDEISSGISEDDVMEKLQDGLLTEGEVKTGDSTAKSAIKKMQSAIGNAWDKAKDTVSNAWGSFTSWITGKGGDEITNNILSEQSSSGAGSSGMGGKTKLYVGGKGGSSDTLNGVPYYSQNDPKYKNKTYHISGDGTDETMGESGCGPTAMAMVASKVTGKKYDPMTMAKMSEAGGYSTTLGTDPNYFSAAANTLGIQSQSMTPSKDNIKSSLDNGNSVILQGLKTGDTNSPFTSEGHYVTATKADDDKIIINDPRGREYSGMYSMSDVLKDSTGMWSFGNGGRGTKSHKGFTAIKGGKGGNKFTASDVIAVAKNEVGYEEKKSASDLNSKHGNAGNGNHTKYEKDVFGSSGNYWCASFVSWCFYTAAGNDKSRAQEVLGTLSMSCETMRQKFISQKRYTDTPQPGACIFFKGSRHAGANHIGIVTSVNGDTVNTVEGNTSSKEYNDNGGCVAEHSYKFGDSKILGYGHPKFDGSSTFGGVNPDGSESSTTTSGDTSSNGVSSFTDAFSGVASAFTNSLMSQLGINVESNNTDTTTSSDSSSTSTSLAGSSSDAVKRVFNDTWVYEMGKKGPGCYHQPLNDGAGWNYGIASFTQKWNMNDLLKYLESNYPDLRKKLKGSVGTSQFNESWAALGKSDEDRFFDAQLKYLFKSKMDPALSKIKSKTGVDLNNGKYSEGVFSMLLSMANQRPKWVDEKWVPYISGHKNASSEDIINNTGGDIAKNYSGNYANGIRSRYQKQVANSLKLNTPFVYNINDVGGKGGKDKPIPMPSNHRNNKVIPMPRRGKGNSLVSSTSSSLSPEIYNITNSKEINNSLSAKETSQLLNTVIACLSKIVDNTGATSEGISDLMNTNFGNTNNIISTTNNNNVISPKDNNKSTSSKPNTDVDRSQYSMAKRVAAGILT